MSETQSLTAPKASFDRRSVVKGAAWSVPVIAAAIAAPAAAASAKTATVSLYGEGSRVTYAPTRNGGRAKIGTAPTGFTIHNTPGAIDDSVPATITITRASSGVPGIGIGIVGGTLVDAGAYVNDVRTITFNIPVKVSGGATQSFSFGSYTQDAPGNGGTAGTYKVTLAIGFTSNNAAVNSSVDLTLTTTDA
ncbi:hypothetical protein [Arthrobacter sp.]|uniref:hypothetical protein n=1 Tax=Arthrobacter sp. TaxID=1667 RepID=UPI003390FD94